MKPFFKNSNNQEQFDKDGFVKLDKTLLNNQEIDQLTSYFYTSGLQQNKEFEVSKDHANKDIVNDMMQLIEHIVLPKLNAYIENVELFIASYLVKLPSNDNAIFPHQDETYVDDNNNFCVNCWIPLVDTDTINGCIGMLKGSHLYFNNICPTPASVCPSPLLEHHRLMISYIEWIPVKKGEVILFNYKTVHASMPNLSNDPRIAISLWIAEKNTKYFTNYLKPGTMDKLLRYEIDKTFYIKYSDSLLSEMYKQQKVLEDFKFLNELDYIWKKLNANELEHQLKLADNKYIEDNVTFFFSNIKTINTFKSTLSHNFNNIIRFLFKNHVN